jgi:hypothetical protein
MVRGGVRTPGNQINGNGLLEGRMWIIIKIAVSQERDAGSIGPEFHHIEIGFDRVALGKQVQDLGNRSCLADGRLSM